MFTNSIGSTHVTVDVTMWSMEQRTGLLQMIDQINGELAKTSSGDHAIPVPSIDLRTTISIPSHVESTGWTYEAYEQVMAGLLSKSYVQAAAIMEAIKGGTGYVTRDDVYALGKYPETRTLKGFTRPVNRVTADLVDSGLLPEDAEDLLRPDYDPAVKSFQRAKGFFVPMEVVKLAMDAKAAAVNGKADEGELTD